jgi:hypothetical protein
MDGCKEKFLQLFELDSIFLGCSPLLPKGEDRARLPQNNTYSATDILELNNYTAKHDASIFSILHTFLFVLGVFHYHAPNRASIWITQLTLISPITKLRAI